MTRQRHVRGGDHLSLVLVLVTLVSLSAAAAMAVQPAPTAISDHHLDRVRGANPNYMKITDQDCSYWNVQAANGNAPPGTTYVTYYGCTAIGQLCITCLTVANGGQDYDLDANDGNHTPVSPRPVQTINCQPNPQGALGSCALPGADWICNTTGVWNCTTGAVNFSNQ
jgi:hypothetical protein